MNMNIEDRQWQAIAQLTTLAGIDSIDIGMRSHGGSFQIFSGLNTCGADIDTALAACRARNRRDCDIYIRPARGLPASLVMLDDLTREVAMSVAEGHAHLLVETSPNNYQLWLKTVPLLDEAERKAVQQALIVMHGGDPGSASGEHFGRFPGFKNRKLKYMLPWVNMIRSDTDAAPLDVDGLFLPPRGECALEPPAGVPLLVPAGDALPARSPSPRSSSGDSMESHKEFKYACESLRHKVSRESIISNIADRALARGKRRTAAQAEQYAARTVAAAERAVL